MNWVAMLVAAMGDNDDAATVMPMVAGGYCSYNHVFAAVAAVFVVQCRRWNVVVFPVVRR